VVVVVVVVVVIVVIVVVAAAVVAVAVVVEVVVVVVVSNNSSSSSSTCGRGEGDVVGAVQVLQHSTQHAENMLRAAKIRCQNSRYREGISTSEKVFALTLLPVPAAPVKKTDFPCMI
jgi:hypothetical protein